VARRALTHGNHPFGAILVDEHRNVLLEAENAYMPAHDGTAHAERLLATMACTTIAPDILRAATLYSSAEPCAMCAGAMYWAGIGRLVYALSEHRLRDITGNHPENPTLNLPCRDVFARGQRSTEVVGPLLEDEAAALHDGVWK
ncbi:MAG: nucleoside deaminase, partial [Bradyrhizobium sp.]